MGARHQARRVAAQALYALEMNPETTPPEALAQALSEHQGGEVDGEFARALALGAWKFRRDSDRAIETASRRWKVGRMDRVDVSVLRLGIYELLRTPETPAPVIVDEGVELAKEFGTPESPAFINGILDRIAQENRGGELGERKG